jgi:hypothetical protein
MAYCQISSRYVQIVGGSRIGQFVQQEAQDVSKDPQYVDEFKRIGLTNGAVRIELGVLPPAEDGQPPVLEAAGMLVMTVEGFVRSAATIDAFLKQLLEKGVIRRDQSPAQPAKPS